MKVTAKLKNYRVSPRKVRLVADLVKGLPVHKALFQLDNSLKKTANQMKKLLLSATANAVNNNKANHEDLTVQDILVGEGVTYKRWMPRAYGRATPIMKRTSNIVVVLDAKKGEESPDLAQKKLKKKDKTSQKRKKEFKRSLVKPEKKDIKKTVNASGTKEKMFRRKSV